MVVLQCWLLGILAAWLRILAGVDLFGLPRWTFFIAAAVLALSNEYFVRRGYDGFRKQFESWPTYRRARWDSGVAVVTVGLFALAMYSAILARRCL